MKVKEQYIKILFGFILSYFNVLLSSEVFFNSFGFLYWILNSLILIVFIILFSKLVVSKKPLNDEIISIFNLDAIILFGINIYYFYPYTGLFLFLVLLSVVLHEFGHLFFMKIFGVDVKEYAIGFGPSLFKKKIAGIVFHIKLLPLGGYVSTKDDKINEINKNDKTLLITKPLWQKILIYAGGVLMNLAFSFFLLVFFISSIFIFLKLTKAKLEASPSQTIQTENSISKKEIKQYCGIDKSIFLGDFKRENNIYLQAVKEVYNGVKLNVCSLGLLLDNKIQASGIKSIVGIAKIVREHKQIMTIYLVILFVAILNLSLFIVNLIPFPGLDGWHIVKDTILTVISKILKKDYLELATNKYLIYTEYAGFVFLLVIGIFLIIRDLI